MWPNPKFLADLVTFTKEILNGKFHFLYSDSFSYATETLSIVWNDWCTRKKRFIIKKFINGCKLLVLCHIRYITDSIIIVTRNGIIVWKHWPNWPNTQHKVKTKKLKLKYPRDLKIKNISNLTLNSKSIYLHLLIIL